jgi:hypothetical protein
MAFSGYTRARTPRALRSALAVVARAGNSRVWVPKIRFRLQDLPYGECDQGFGTPQERVGGHPELGAEGELERKSPRRVSAKGERMAERSRGSSPGRSRSSPPSTRTWSSSKGLRGTSRSGTRTDELMRLRWSAFQPARVVQFSPGDDNCGGPGVCDALRPPPANQRRAFAQSEKACLHWGTPDESGGGPGVWAARYRPATVNCPLARIRHGQGRKPAAAWVTLWVTRVAQTTPRPFGARP